MARKSSGGTDWTDKEVDLIVGEYFGMLKKELSHQRYVKLRVNESIQCQTGRSKGSVEFKNQNISAILQKLGMPWIPGYVPLYNYQSMFFDSIERFLSSQDPLDDIHIPVESELAEAGTLFVYPPPDLEEGIHPENIHLERLIRKFDPAERDERNRILGHCGEEMVFNFERKRLFDLGKEDLARNVRWVPKEDGDGAGYDIRSCDISGNERLLEVKTTRGYAKTPFYLSRNELEFSKERPEAFRIMRLYDFATLPKAFELAHPLGDVLRLRPDVYKATFS